MMENLHTEMKQIMDANGWKQNFVAESAGITTRFVSEFMAGKLSNPDFASLFELVKFLAKDDACRYMYDYCASTDKQSQIQAAFEYASLYSLKNLLGHLVEAHADNKRLSDWIAVYRLQFEHMTEIKETEDVIEECRELLGRLKAPEMRAKIALLEVSLYYALDKIDVMMSVSAKLADRIAALKAGFVKNAMTIHLNCFYAAGYLYAHADYEKAESCALEIAMSKASTSRMRASAYHTIGHANAYKDVDKAIKYYEKAARLYRLENMNDYAEGIEKSDIPFVKNVNGVIFDAIEAIDGERAHQEIVKGNNEKAKQILSEVILSGEGNLYTDFYLATISNDIQALAVMYGQLVKEGNLYFANLVLKQIKQ